MKRVFFRKKTDDAEDGDISPKKCKYKKKGILDYISVSVGIVIGLIIIYNLFTMYGLEQKFVTGEHIAVVQVSGTISSDAAANANALGLALKEALESDKSKAVALVIKSGGGAPYESEKLFREIQYLKAKHKDKKIYAVVENLGASAAYHIASASDEIIVGETSMIGSIGVILSNYDIRQLHEKLGIKDRTMTAGENKAMLAYGKDITPFQQEHVNKVLSQVHQKFIDDVKLGRKGKIKDSPEMFSGLFWVGQEAVSLGVADRIGDMNTLKRELKINKTKDYTKSNRGFGALMGASLSFIGQGIAHGIVAELKQDQSLSLQ